MEKRKMYIPIYTLKKSGASIPYYIMRMNGKNELNGLEAYLKQVKQSNGSRTYIAYKSGERGYELVTKLRNVLKVEDLVADLLEKWVEENKEALEKIGIEL